MINGLFLQVLSSILADKGLTILNVKASNVVYYGYFDSIKSRKSLCREST